MKIDKKKILVTGGAGFVGSELCKQLALDGSAEVYSLDNYSTGNKKNHCSKVKYFRGDTKDIDKIIKFSPDVVFHLGEYSRVEQSFKDIAKVWESNKISILPILDFCRKNSSKLIYAGSSTKYGDNGLGKNQSPYAWSKYSNTELVQNYHEWFGLDYAITYFYNVYGEKEISEGEYSTLIAIFCRQMQNKDCLTVVAPGSQTRNFTHISDIVSGLIEVGKNGSGDGYGIGSPEAYSIIEVAEMFEGKIKFLPERKGNRNSSPVITKKTEALGWSPKMKLPEYIKQLKKKGWIQF